MAKQLELDFMFVPFTDHNGMPYFVKPTDIKYIKPACPNGFHIYLKDRSSIKVAETAEEIKNLLGQCSYKFIEKPKTNGKTRRKTTIKAKTGN